ncbi:exodeoxyribonuclease VII small subunit [Neisseriaceae bacterium PsAf]|nr:exodeoxyribonuclease VII small subunit [Neisseriaceae bacterium PsAf]MCV2502692.1 exodeoxyribonuclease VII small subunit [Neisseriaceae bacterium]
MSEEQLSFEAAMQELENITTKMQDKNVSLEDSLNYYQQGIKLVDFCQKKLQEVEQKIEILNSKNELEDFNQNEL